MPVIRGRCWENAARRSFFSRDNMENFIQFCRRLGVHENLLFESDDLGKGPGAINFNACELTKATAGRGKGRGKERRRKKVARAGAFRSIGRLSTRRYL